MSRNYGQRASTRAVASRREPAGFFVGLWAGALLIATCLVVTAAMAQEVRTPTAAEQAALMRPSDMGFGGLLLNSQFAGYYVEAPLVATDVDITVTGAITRTKVTQRFRNPSQGWVEGIYVFPLPEDSAVDTLRMMIGDRTIEGQIKERQEARIIYEEAKAAGFKASLVEQERPNIFTNSVANIGPGETVVVQIEYQGKVRLDNGEFSLRFPMVVAPRYNPKPELQMVSFGERTRVAVSDPVPDRDRIEPPYLRPDKSADAPLVNPVTLAVHLKTGYRLGEIASRHHEVIVQRDGKDGATLALKDGEVAANQDFELVWAPDAETQPEAALFRESRDGEDYLLAMVVPPHMTETSDAPIRSRETIFVIDNSGSMGGESIRQAKASLLMALDRLQPTDLFNVIRFDDTMELVFPRPVPADATNVAFAKHFVGDLEADGGTEMLPALEAALVDLTPNDTSRVRQVIFLTDGSIGNEDQLFAAIDRGLGRSRLFTVGIGSAPNSYFMSRAARIGRGIFTYIGDLAEVQTRMAALFEKIERPVMTDLKAEWPDGSVVEAWPSPLPDLYAGEPVVVAAKLAEVKGKLLFTGNLNGAAWQVELPLDKAIAGTGVAQLWAREKIANIEDTRFMGADGEAVDKAVLAVALDYHLVSRLTSLVAVDVTPSRPVGAPLARGDMPLNLPKGWDFDKVFGKDIDARPKPDTRRAEIEPKVQLTALKISAAAPQAESADMGAELMLPQGATPANWLVLSGLLSILLSIALWFAYGRLEPTRGKIRR